MIVAAALVLTLAVGVGGGWVAADRLQSPAQIEAAAQAPAPGPVTAAVVASDLAETITSQAVVGRTDSHSATIPLPSADLAVVTASPIGPGASVSAGTAVVSVNDRPVFALPGKFPLYRDIGAGDTGADVRQLQDGLRAAGYRIRDREMGTFGSDTAKAIRSLYKANGYSVVQVEVDGATTAGKPAANGSAAGGTPAADGSTAGGVPAADGSTAGGTPAADGSAATDTPAAAPNPAETAPVGPVTRLVVPRTEVAVVATLPAVLAAAPPVGSVLTAENATITLESGALAAIAPVAVSVAGRLAIGATATLQDTAGTSVEASVTAVIPAATDGTQAQLILAPTTGALPDTWIGATVLATISIQVVATDALVVPTSAVATTGSGPPRVLKEQPDGSFTTVEVKELGTLSGRSAVAPLTPGELVEGDKVRVD